MSRDAIATDTALRVQSVRPVLLSATYRPGEELTWVGGTIWSWDAALVEVTLSDGTTGLGEAGAGIMAAQQAHSALHDEVQRCRLASSQVDDLIGCEATLNRLCQQGIARLGRAIRQAGG